MTVLVTGANRGIGLELTRIYTGRGDNVFAACREPAKATTLQSTGARLFPFDAAGPVAPLIFEVATNTSSLDLLINNAGIYSGKGDRWPEPLGELNADDAALVFRVNAITPILLAQGVLDLLRSGSRPKVVSITSGYGSVSSNDGHFPYHYSASKAALNQYMRSFGWAAERWGIATAVINPGWVSTDMGGPGANLAPSDSAEGIVRVIDSLQPSGGCAFLDWMGRTVPW
jgi:NAD(P)-dependent dehydrogenase (short-subunit alcohol dehydrogenase family)